MTDPLLAVPTEKTSSETWAPTVQLTFKEMERGLILHQLWVSTLGNTQWREVPVQKSNECVAGFVEDDEL